MIDIDDMKRRHQYRFFKDDIPDKEIIDKIVSETGVSKRALNNTPPNYIRHVYINNQTASNGSLTESFIRSRASLSPSDFHNEIVTRYNMISAIPKDLTHLKKSVEKYA